MASRTILRRRSCISNHINSPCLVPSFQNTGHGQYVWYMDSQGCGAVSNHPSTFSNRLKGTNATPVSKEDFFGIQGVRHFPQSFRGTTIPGQRTVRSELYSSGGITLMLLHPRNASTAAAGLPDSGGDDDEDDGEKEVLVAKKRKEASPEECDQAIEGLSIAMAKARAKREDWAKKMIHWKDEFLSTLQHYWLGIRLLWADVRSSLRFLIKLTGGKGLSRRERQQLTRTTADIFRLVPFAVFIIVPFMEFLLPIFLKLFPNMLPSTFQDKMK